MKETDRTAARDTLWDSFVNPGGQYRPIPKWIWNTPLSNISAPMIREQFVNFRDRDGYGGVMIVLWGHEGYMSEEFLEKYGQALDIAGELGMSIILWDENGFPTGSAGGLFEKAYPELTAGRLDMHEVRAEGPCDVSEPVPGGTLMGVVALKDGSGERMDLTGRADGGSLRCALPEGSWRILFFTCVKEEAFGLMGGSYRFIDYLNPRAVDKFIEMTHQRYYDRFSRHFGSTIRYAFYDEPSFWRLQGRIWTEGFNGEFEARHGYSPVPYYPALWMDIGPETRAARAALLGFGAELYAGHFVGRLRGWCADHGIGLTGHMDQEEIANPVPLSGDLMKVFERQDMPGVDEIAFYGRGSRGYKVVSSAAFNYDKPLVMCEAYGAMGEDMPADVLYRDAMDLYAKGVNFMVPHGTWYDNVKDVIFPPELSYRSAKFGPELPGYNEYAARLSAMLQGGVHVADIAVLYPIAALEAGNVFGQGDAYLGGVIAGETNYMELGETLSLDIRRDFTYLHPEVLEGRCSVGDAELRLDNAVNRECYQVLVIPGADVISAGSARKIRQFYDRGGKVVSVGRLPGASSEFVRDRQVRADMTAIFGDEAYEDVRGKYRLRINDAGGRAYRLPALRADILRAALDDALPAPDVRFGDGIQTPGGNLSYIHKIKDGTHILFVANSGDKFVDTTLTLRGAHAPELWDPHLGGKRKADYQLVNTGLYELTAIRIELPPVRSVFLGCV